MTATGGPPHELYEQRRLTHATDRARLERASTRLGTVRAGAFVAALAPWVVAELSATVPDVVGWASVPLAIVFFVLVGRHRRLRERVRRVAMAEALAAHGLARLDRRWDDLPDATPAPAEAGASHPFAADLDLYGHASLRALLGPTYTPPGAATLDRWLLQYSSPSEVRLRQKAVRELAGMVEAREQAAVVGAMLEPVESTVLARFLEWCVAPPVVPAWVARLAAVLPLVTLTAAVGDGLGRLPAWSWAVPLALQAALAWRWGERLHLEFNRGSSGAPGLRRYHGLLGVWESLPTEGGMLHESVATLRDGDETASAALMRLERWLEMADARFSSLHPVLGVGLLWDIHVGRGLDRWRASAGRRAREWMDALGTLEALTSLATLSADHPEWAFATFAEATDPPRFRAVELGHPLLGDATGVRNDVELGPPGRVLLITGSNMSGKSTLLRSIGLAVVLARAGGPVCARALTLPGCSLFTSMRVQDSLEAGVSFFMAELQRLAALLAAAPATDGTRPPLLYLVDEILQGTNSDERRVAGRRLIRHLLRRRAIGAVTTHDLEFHRHPEVEAAADMVHFRESLAGEAGAEMLSFDYRLRPGLATTRNALRLAEIVGLTDPEAAPISE